CSHEDTSLSEGWYENGALQCPEHGSSFDCKTGAVMSLPASVPIRVFPVRITDGNVEIGGVEDAIGVS
ncbi:MAG: 3-phenylpropionate/trans-cinnamate dioxygenase ferredoxin component, partial [Actinomycetota bacterium]|nr:3-phenylpropionate/trans-cinnamate dioxygenase ferredoxin component [Actinomycetota bacterium]